MKCCDVLNAFSSLGIRSHWSVYQCCKYANTQIHTNESVMRIVSADWKCGLMMWDKIQGADIWAASPVIMRRYVNICIHLSNLGEDVLHEEQTSKQYHGKYSQVGISWYFAIFCPSIKKNEYKRWFSIWDCRREWFCPDLNGVSQIAFQRQTVYCRPPSIFIPHSFFSSSPVLKHTIPSPSTSSLECYGVDPCYCFNPCLNGVYPCCDPVSGNGHLCIGHGVSAKGRKPEVGTQRTPRTW